MTAQLALAAVVQGRPQKVAGRKRGAKPKPAPSFTPHPCVVLGLDPATTSGWAVLVRGVLAHAPSALGVPCGGSALVGTARDAAGRADAIRRALDYATGAGLPLVVVAEKWSPGGRIGYAQLAALHGHWARWADSLEEQGVPPRRILRVWVQTWHPAVFGKGHGQSPDWKRISVAWARHRFGLDVTHDVSDALAIAAWGAHAGEVLERLPKRATSMASGQVADRLSSTGRLGAR